MRALLAVFLFLAMAGRLWADESAVEVQAVLTTVDDEQISGPIKAVEEGQLVLAGDVPRRVPLVDLQRVELGRSIAVSTADLAWIGQDNHDLVQIGAAAGGNGIQDLHLRCGNLAAKPLKQIVAVCRFPGQLRVWRLDTSQSPHWRLAIARAELSREADLYLEPAAIDSFGTKFDFTFTYADGSTSKANVTATTHSSDQLKVAGAAPAKDGATPTAQAPTAKWGKVYLSDAEELSADVASLDAESVTLRMPWKAELRVPLVRVRGIWLATSAAADARAEFDKRLAAPTDEDVVFLMAKDQSSDQIEGSLRGLADGKLTLGYQGTDRGIKQERLLGLVLAAHPKIPLTTSPFQVFRLASDGSLSGQWVGVNGRALIVETPWQARVEIPAEEISEIRFRNGKLTSLADLEPAVVEEVPYFGRMVHWRRDDGFAGSPARLKGKQPVRCLAMHSRTVLTYALDGQFEKFKTTLGFDDSAAGRGRAACRVLVDGREAFAESDLRSPAEPRQIEISLAGAKQLVLEVDFGADQDVGDRVLWAEPRLFRAGPK